MELSLVKTARFLGVLLSLVACSTEPATQNLEALRGFQGLAILLSDFSAPGQIAFHDGNRFLNLRVPTHSDSRLRWFPQAHQLYVIQRLEADSFFSLDLAEGKRTKEIPVLRGKNVQDVLPTSAGTAWVSALNSPEIVHLDMKNGAVLSSVSLPPDQRDTDGSSDPSYLGRSGDFFSIYFQRLSGFVPDKEALLLRWTQEGTVLPPVPLAFKNPVTEFKSFDGKFYLGEAGIRMGKQKLGNEQDGGIEELDETFLPVRTVVTEKTLEGDLLDFDIIDEHFGVAAVSTPDSRLVAFDPATGQKLPIPTISEKGYRFVQVFWQARSQRLLVADKGSAEGSPPRIRIFDNRMNEKAPLILPLAPVQILDISP